MLRALSLTQPWATLIAIGAKRWETRGWPTPYRGEIAIHASKGYPIDCQELCEFDPFRSALVAGGIEYVDGPKPFGGERAVLPLGSIIALATLADCVRITQSNAPPSPESDFGDYSPGRLMFRLTDVRRLAQPIQAKGALGIWVVPPEIEAAVRDRCGGTVGE